MNQPYVAEFLVTFNKEVSQKFGLNTNRAFRSSMTNAVINLRSYTYPAATHFFFCLYYGAKEERENAIWGLFERKPHQSMENFISLNHLEAILTFSLEDFNVLANEFLAQYKESNPRFLDVHNHPECQKEFDTLKTALADHPVLLYKSVSLCEKVHTSPEFVNPCVSYLLSEKDREQIEGLKMLGFNFSYRSQLRSFVTEIGQFLKAMHNAYTENQHSLTAHQDEGFNTPFSQLSELLKKMQEEAASDTDTSSSQQSDEPNDDNQCLDVQPITERPSLADMMRNYPLADELCIFLDNKSQIAQNVPRSEELWECLQALRKLGVDINLLIDKEEYLLPILMAHDALEEAFTTLQATREKYNTSYSSFHSKMDGEANKGLLSFSLAYPEIIQNVLECRKAFDDAQGNYDSAFNNFVDCCKSYEKAVSNVTCTNQ